MLLVQSLQKRYDGNMVLRDVSLELEPGGALCITGPSGCGKTTLLRILAGLLPPDGGTIHLGGTLLSDRHKSLPPHRRGIALAFQSPALFPHMSVGENIRFGMRGDLDVAPLCESLGIDDIWNSRPGEISGGQAKRVELARALAADCRVLLLDEPAAHLDAERRDAVLDILLKQVRGRGTAMLYITHDERELERIGAPVLLLENGRLRSV